MHCTCTHSTDDNNNNNKNLSFYNQKCARNIRNPQYLFSLCCDERTRKFVR